MLQKKKLIEDCDYSIHSQIYEVGQMLVHNMVYNICIQKDTLNNKSSPLRGSTAVAPLASKLPALRGISHDPHTQILKIINQLHKGCLSDSVSFLGK